MRRATLLPDHLLPDDRCCRRGRAGRSASTAGTFVRDTPATGAGAEPALYVHGLGGSSQNWTDLAGLLADRLDGQAIDLPGFGVQRARARSYTIAAHRRPGDPLDRARRPGPGAPVRQLAGRRRSRCGSPALRPDLVRTLTLISPAMPFLDPRRSAQGRLLPLLPCPRRAAGRPPAGPSTARGADPARSSKRASATRGGILSPTRMAEAVEEAKLRCDVALVRRRVRAARCAVWSAASCGRTCRARARSGGRRPGAGADPGHRRRPGPAGRRPGGAAGRAGSCPDWRLLLLRGIGHVAQMEVPRNGGARDRRTARRKQNRRAGPDLAG